MPPPRLPPHYAAPSSPPHHEPPHFDPMEQDGPVFCLENLGILPSLLNADSLQSDARRYHTEMTHDGEASDSGS